MFEQVKIVFSNRIFLELVVYACLGYFLGVFIENGMFREVYQLLIVIIGFFFVHRYMYSDISASKHKQYAFALYRLREKESLELLEIFTSRIEDRLLAAHENIVLSEKLLHSLIEQEKNGCLLPVEQKEILLLLAKNLIKVDINTKKFNEQISELQEVRSEVIRQLKQT